MGQVPEKEKSGRPCVEVDGNNIRGNPIEVGLSRGTPADTI